MLGSNNIDLRAISCQLTHQAQISWTINKSKLAAIIQTALMNEAERAEYCRANGLYPEQIDGWKAAFESTDISLGFMSKADIVALAAERKKSQTLERNLCRKDRALAETAALVVLAKKAEAI